MSKLSKAVASQREENILRLKESVVNFMGGTSYEINPLDTLKMVTASSIFGEPSYYRSGRDSKAYVEYDLISGFTILPNEFLGQSTETIMETVIDEALDYDFQATLEWAVTLRNEFHMRLNPQVIMVRAALHPDRKKFSSENPGLFNRINQQVMYRPDEPMSQMAYYMYKNEGNKHKIPSILKRSWANTMNNYSRYAINKYKNHEIGMINAVRLCHANSSAIDELMRKGSVKVENEEKTWEQYRSDGKDWKWILDNCKLGHMALLRNLRGIFTEIDDINICKTQMNILKHGVLKGKQFPFRYYSAIEAIRTSNCNFKPIIMDSLEECMDIAVGSFPKLRGKTICLSDNSGSAWYSFTSEYGTIKIAEIDNLSSVITAACSDEGYVGVFGDTVKIQPISKRNGILSQANMLSEPEGEDVGLSTEGGIWEFFKNAIQQKIKYDNIFIYSDQQASHADLYGSSEQQREYKSKGFSCNSSYISYINVFKLILDYRQKVNPKVNVFSIQTAGYNNIVIPEMAYRTAILYGWTGREAEFAQKYIQLWDEIENRN